MEKEAFLCDRTTRISAKELKASKAPLAPGTPSNLWILVPRMMAGYKVLFGPNARHFQL
jgi:hypothetical protein